MTIETANRLYELRKKNNLSQEELAEKLGVSRQAVSKWERSEASPDTDNLIALAKIYGLSVDELLFGNDADDDASLKEDKEHVSSDEAADCGEGDKTFIRVTDNKNKVSISPKGILVETDDGDRVKINLTGIHIEASNDDEDDDDDEKGENEDSCSVHIGAKGSVNINAGSSKSKFWAHLPYPIICVAAYILFGCYDILGGFGKFWVIFLTIPIYYTLIEAIIKKRFSEFAYPVLTVLAYLCFGLYMQNWHPSWVVFLTIPVYYAITEPIDRRNRKHRKFKIKADVNSD